MRREPQLVSGGSCLFEDREGADALVVELLLWSREVKVGRVQPDLVTDVVVARRRFLLVVLTLHVGCSLLKRLAGFSMNVAHHRDEIGRSGIGNGVVILGVGEESRVTAVEDQKGLLPVAL